MNDWFDRHVDAINEPNRPIPSGRMPGRWGLYIAIVWTVLSLLVATLLGRLGFRRRGGRPRARLGLQRAAVPAEAERLVGQCRGRGLLRGPALVHRRRRDGGARCPTGASSLLAALYSVGAHGIMTLNDFKSIEGDRRMGIALAAGAARRRARGAARLRRHGGAAGRRGRAAAALGPAAGMPPPSAAAARRCSFC